MYNSILSIINCIEALEKLALGRVDRIESVIFNDELTDEGKVKLISSLFEGSKLFNTERLMSDSEFNISELRSMIEVLHKKGSL